MPDTWQRNTGNQSWTTQKLLSSQLDQWQDGDIEEFQDWVRKPNPWPGIVQGLTPSISGTKVQIASGIGLVNGLVTLGTRAAPTSPDTYPETVTMEIDFTGESDTDYWGYIDSSETDESNALKITSDWATTADDRAHILLFKVTWASPTLSSLLDLRAWGVDAAPLMHFERGSITAVDHLLAVFVIDEKCAIRKPWLTVGDPGSAAGPTRIKIETGTSGNLQEIWSDTNNRFSIANADTNDNAFEGTYPDQNMELVAGNIVKVSVSGTPATNLAHIAVMIPRFYYDEVA